MEPHCLLGNCVKKRKQFPGKWYCFNAHPLWKSPSDDTLPQTEIFCRLKNRNLFLCCNPKADSSNEATLSVHTQTKPISKYIVIIYKYFLCSHFGGGVPPSVRRGGRALFLPDRRGGTPILPEWGGGGVLPSFLIGDTPILGQNGGYTLQVRSQAKTGGGGVPPNAAGDMPLASTQEDFLVYLEFSTWTKVIQWNKGGYVFKKLPFNPCLFIKFVTRLQ